MVATYTPSESEDCRKSHKSERFEVVVNLGAILCTSRIHTDSLSLIALRNEVTPKFSFHVLGKVLEIENLSPLINESIS